MSKQRSNNSRSVVRFNVRLFVCCDKRIEQTNGASTMIQLTTASRALAMLRSRNAIKDELRKQGIKITTMSAAELSSWARLFLEDHQAEIIPAAIEEARRMILSGAMGKRAQRALRANLTSPAQTPSEPKSTTSAVQMSGAK
jgi:hypothetical protein